jgi:hypothetical protein
MVRRARCCVLIVFALALSAANHSNGEGASEKQGAQRTVAASFQNISASYDQASERAQSAEKEEAKCGPEKYASSTDLCAQWKAADAASDSAWWAWASGLVGFGSLLGVIVALGIALNSNWIARDTAKRQLRAYLTVEPGGVSEAVGGMHQVPIDLINNGQTPAYDLEQGGDFLVITGDPRHFDPGTDGRLSELDPEDCVASTDAVLGPNTNRFTYAYLEEALPKPFWQKIYAKEAAIIHYGFFRYKDVFGERHQTNFAFYHWGEDLSDVYSKRCRFGNHAD